LKCKACGRVFPDDANYCGACGTPNRKKRFVKFQSLGETLSMEVPVGKKTRRVWSVCLRAVLCMALLAGIAAVAPTVGSFLGAKKQELEEVIKPAPQQVQVEEIERVSGPVVYIDGDFVNVFREEHAYSDGTWNRTELIDDKIIVRYNRLLPSDTWVASHVLSLYPDVQEVEEFPERSDANGYETTRVQVSYTASAPDCVVEVMYIHTEDYDFVTAVEVPTGDFADYEKRIDMWFGQQKLKDAQTGEELFAPSDEVTPSDVASATDSVNTAV